MADSTEETFESLLAGMAVGDLMANPEDPHSFYQKAPDGVVVLHQCGYADQNGNKMVFNPELNVCVMPQDYGPPNA